MISGDDALTPVTVGRVELLNSPVRHGADAASPTSSSRSSLRTPRDVHKALKVSFCDELQEDIPFVADGRSDARMRKLPHRNPHATYVWPPPHRRQSGRHPSAKAIEPCGGARDGKPLFEPWFCLQKMHDWWCQVAIEHLSCYVAVSGDCLLIGRRPNCVDNVLMFTDAEVSAFGSTIVMKGNPRPVTIMLLPTAAQAEELAKELHHGAQLVRCCHEGNWKAMASLSDGSLLTCSAELGFSSSNKATTDESSDSLRWIKLILCEPGSLSERVLLEPCSVFLASVLRGGDCLPTELSGREPPCKGYRRPLMRRKPAHFPHVGAVAHQEV
mmetsp:Transcript_15164/g.34555  ORF Transcript_15164/g.34555 Transcript_15164/m.34555 type:complete len:328 (+) Transcript_15164:53-1036(+)